MAMASDYSLGLTFCRALLALSIPLIFSLLFLRQKTQKANKTNCSKTSCLQVLCTILTPTNSAWPTQYAPLLVCKSRRNPNVIEIQLLKLINNIRLGALELRDPRILADIFRGQLHVYGWEVLIGLDTPWWFCVYWYFTRLYTLFIDKEHQPRSMRYSSMSVVASPPLLPLCYIAPVHDLDIVPSSRLAPTIRAIQSSIGEAETAVIEFTTLAPHITVNSHQFVLCSLLSLFKYPGGESFLVQFSYPSTPMYRFIELLSTGPSSAKIMSVTDISETCAETLLGTERELAANNLARKIYVEKWGHEAWRERRFLLSWESGLLLSGCLLRWRVVLKG